LAEFEGGREILNMVEALTAKVAAHTGSDGAPTLSTEASALSEKLLESPSSSTSTPSKSQHVATSQLEIEIGGNVLSLSSEKARDRDKRVHPEFEA